MISYQVTKMLTSLLALTGLLCLNLHLYIRWYYLTYMTLLSVNCRQNGRSELAILDANTSLIYSLDVPFTDIGNIVSVNSVNSLPCLS